MCWSSGSSLLLQHNITSTNPIASRTADLLYMMLFTLVYDFEGQCYPFAEKHFSGLSRYHWLQSSYYKVCIQLIFLTIFNLVTP